MNLRTLGEFLNLCVILLYNTATATHESILIPVNISCHPTTRPDEIFSQWLDIANNTLAVDRHKSGITYSSDLWNISVTGNFSREPFLEGKGHADCSVACDIKCGIYGYFNSNMTYKHLSYTPRIDYGVVNKAIRTPRMLICEVVSGPTTRKMRWQIKTGEMFKDILASVSEHEQDTCLTTSKLKYDGNDQAQYRCMFGDIEVGSTGVSGTETDLSIHFFLSSILIVYSPLLLNQLLSTGHLTSNRSEILRRRLMASIPPISCAVFTIWWIILLIITRTTEYLRFFILEVAFYGLHSVAHLRWSLSDEGCSPVDKWRRALCFAAFINPVICWVVMNGLEADGTKPLGIVWWCLALICSIVQVQTQS